MKRNIQYLVAALFVLLGIVLIPGAVAGPQVQSLTQLPVPTLISVSQIPVKTRSVEPVASVSSKRRAVDSLDAITAQAVYVVDIDSGTVLYEKNATSLRFPASTTKLMTALVVREIFDLNQKLVVPEGIQTAGTTLGFYPGEIVSVKDLLAAALIQSANDAAIILARNHPQGVAGFVSAMNQKSQQLHLEQTTFKNPHGIDEVEQQTTARDLSILARKVMQDPELVRLYSAPTAVIERKTPQILFNTHALLGKDGVVGMKTGTTELAGEVLITQAEFDNRAILLVLMGSQNRYDETSFLLHWVKSHYYWLDPSEAVTLNVD